MKTTPTIAKIALPNHLGIGFSSGRPTHEGGVKCPHREPKCNGGDSDAYKYHLPRLASSEGMTVTLTLLDFTVWASFASEVGLDAGMTYSPGRLLS